jgi:membrane protein
MLSFRDVALAAKLTGQEFRGDRGTDRSAALAYVTLLSLVPLLATAAALFRAFFPFGTDRLIEMVTVVLPYEPGTEQHGALIQTLSEFVNRATSLGYISFLIFIAIAYRLFQSVESAFNDIWNVDTKRSPATKVFSFTMLVFWGPVVVGVGSSALIWMTYQPWAPSRGLILTMLQLALPLLGLTMVYWLAPHTSVHVGAALTGGLVATVGLQLLRSVFVWYLDLFPDINIIYGSATLAVLFLVSLFAFWVLVIIGAEVAYVAQNFNALRLEHEGRRRLGADPAVVAAAVLTECYRRAAAGEPAATLDNIEEALGVGHAATQRATERLVGAGLLAVTGPERDGFVPGRDPHRLSVAQALEAGGAPRGELPAAGSEAMSRLGELLRSAEVRRRDLLDGITFADLIEADAGNDEQAGGLQVDVGG